MKTWYKNKRVFNKDNTVQIFKTTPSLFKAIKCSKAKNTDLNETIQMNSKCSKKIHNRGTCNVRFNIKSKKEFNIKLN